ncbi:MAG TPA: hypothetical protein VE196_00585, partial [Pseudonocardiaceae bacterium]|nr:hypothetical protein [Pseudonocardiaceae bacterium]
ATTPAATTPAVAVLDPNEDLDHHLPAEVPDIPPGADLGALGFLGPRLAGLGAWGHLLRQTHPDAHATHGPPPATAIGTALARVLGLHTTQPDTTQPDTTQPGMTQPGVTQAGVTQANGGLARLIRADPHLWTPLHVGRHGVAVGMGTDHGATLPLDLTTAPGIAIGGRAAADVVRALLLNILAGPFDQPPGQVLITRADAHTLLGAAPNPYPAGLRIVPTLTDALTRLTDTIQRRLTTPNTTMNTATAAAEQPLTVLLCIQPPREHHLAGLAAVLGQATRSGVGALILGQGWPSTPTITTSTGGIVTATHGDAITYLHHARLYNLPATHAVELCTLIAHTQHTDPTSARN